jgi:hypothetical protein
MSIIRPGNSAVRAAPDFRVEIRQLSRDIFDRLHAYVETDGRQLPLTKIDLHITRTHATSNNEFDTHGACIAIGVTCNNKFAVLPDIVVR